MKVRFGYFYRMIQASFILVMFFLCNQAAGADPVIMDGPDKDSHRNNGELTLWLANNNQMHKLGILAYDQNTASKNMDISRHNLSGKVTLVITHKGNSAAHIDAVLVDNQGPVSVDGTSENKELAIKKLSQVNNDLIDAYNRRLQLDFFLLKPAKTITLAARIEPAQLSRFPFTFPLDNLYSPITTGSVFYEYLIDSHEGKIGIDQVSDSVKPFFKVFSEAGSGHPSEFTYGWVSNDEQNLYVTIDFSGDNTMDRDGKDYAKVHINTTEGIKTFPLTHEKQKWGKSKFTYTASNSFQHRVYEFVIPFWALGADLTQKIKIAFEAYGTLAPPPLPVYLPDHVDPVDPDDQVDLDEQVDPDDPKASEDVRQDAGSSDIKE